MTLLTPPPPPWDPPLSGDAPTYTTQGPVRDGKEVRPSTGTPTSRSQTPRPWGHLGSLLRSHSPGPGVGSLKGERESTWTTRKDGVGTNHRDPGVTVTEGDHTSPPNPYGNRTAPDGRGRVSRVRVRSPRERGSTGVQPSGRSGRVTRRSLGPLPGHRNGGSGAGGGQAHGRKLLVWGSGSGGEPRVEQVRTPREPLETPSPESGRLSICHRSVSVRTLRPRSHPCGSRPSFSTGVGGETTPDRHSFPASLRDHWLWESIVLGTPTRLRGPCVYSGAPSPSGTRSSPRTTPPRLSRFLGEWVSLWFLEGFVLCSDEFRGPRDDDRQWQKKGY